MDNLYLIIGENKEQIDFYLKEILNKIDFSEDNKITYDLNESTISDILDEASMISLFAQTKVIIGSNFDITKMDDLSLEYLTKYVNSPSKDAYIILIAKSIDARKASYKIFKNNFKIIDTSKTNNKEDIFTYVKKKIKDNKYDMNDSTIEYLLSKTNNNISDIDNELNKLFIYKEDNKTITISDIDTLVPDSIDNIIYEFTNAILENDYDTIVKMYNNFKIENISFDYLISSIANSFRQALTIKILNNDKESISSIAKTIGKKEFYVKKMLERIYNYTEEDLTKYINKLALIDRNYKSGKSNIDELELFLLNKNS